MASLVRKKGPILTPGKKKPMPIKPGPKGGKNPKLPYRFPDGKQPMPKLPKPKKDGVKKPGGSIRDLIYRAKPGEMTKMRKGFESALSNKGSNKPVQGMGPKPIGMIKRPKRNPISDMMKSGPITRKFNSKDVQKGKGIGYQGGSIKKKPVVPRKPGMGR